MPTTERANGMVRGAKTDRPGLRRRSMKSRFMPWRFMFLFVFCGIVLYPGYVHADEQPSSGPSIVIEDPDLAAAQNDTGYVDMDGDEAGDLFVDEDGDGLDDRHLKRHQKRNWQRWSDDHQTGSSLEDGEKGYGGQKGYGAGPGRGGR
jgi:hypothetical protein